MKILIATQNQDKFRIVKGLLSNCGLSECEFKNLNDVNIASQTEEYGSLINRALMKAQYAHEVIGEDQQIDIFVGVDDGMKYKGGETDGNSKEITEKILCHNLLDVGEVLVIVRAFALLDKNGATIDEFETEIPYKFLGNINNIQPQDAKYPLGCVLSPLDGDKPLTEMGDEASMDYYLKFSRERISDAVNKIAS